MIFGAACSPRLMTARSMAQVLRGRQQSTDRPEQHNTLINPVLPMRADSVKSFRVLRLCGQPSLACSGRRATNRRCLPPEFTSRSHGPDTQSTFVS